MNIRDIETLTEEQAKEMALETMNIKDHNVYFVNCGNGFDYSVLVFKNGHHIHYANDYKLHHSKNTSDEELREMYIKSLNHKLYTDEELIEPLKNYDEYRAKSYFLHNYYGMQKPHVSIFHIFHSDEEEKAYDEQVKDMIYDRVAFARYDKKDLDFVKHHEELHDILEQRFSETATNYEYQKSAFRFEMANHEYHINWQADFDTLSAFGNVQWHGDGYGGREEREAYFDDLGFNDVQRRAYEDARKEYLASCDY